MMRSPGEAASIALWMVALAATCFGSVPPTVTVTVSIERLPVAPPRVTTSSPQRARGLAGVPSGPPYCGCCCNGQTGTFAGTVTVIAVSVHDVTGAFTPPMVTDPPPGPKP